MTRREFFASLGRAAAFVGLGGLAARLFSSARRGASSGTAVCSRCPVLSRCRFPGGVRTRDKLRIQHPSETAPPGDREQQADVRGLCGARLNASDQSERFKRKTT